MLESHKLRLFLSIAELGSISRAADAHYMTPPAMSQHLAGLEAYLGVSLVQRHRRGVRLTDDGQRLYAYAKQIIALIQEAEASLIRLSADSTGQISIGATPGISTYRLPEWSQAFASQYPRLMIHIHTGITEHILADVRMGKLDLGLVEGDIPPEDAPHVQIIPLETVSHQVIIGRGHAWWGRESLAFAELDGAEMVIRQSGQTRQWLDEMFKAHGIKPLIRIQMHDPEGIKGWVKHRDMTILPAYTVQKEIAEGVLWAIRIADVPMIRQHKVFWNAHKRLSPFARAFLSALQTSEPMP